MEKKQSTKSLFARIEFPVSSIEDFERRKEASQLPNETWTLIKGALCECGHKKHTYQGCYKQDCYCARTPKQVKEEFA